METVRDGEEGSPAMVGEGGMTSSNDFWGDELGNRQDYFRVVYNNVNGLMIGDYMKTKLKN